VNGYGFARVTLQAASVACGAIGFDTLLAAALVGGPRTAEFLLRAAILMGIATAFLWGKEKL
jgi:hypothetical protein